MQARHLGRPGSALRARLQLILILLAFWNILTFCLELTNTPLLEVGGVDGMLGARSASGAIAVLAVAYLYAARNPIRYRFVLGLAVIEQFIAMFSSTFHWARGDVCAGEAVLPIFVAAAFLLAIVSNLPRQTDAI